MGTGYGMKSGLHGHEMHITFELSTDYGTGISMALLTGI